MQTIGRVAKAIHLREKSRGELFFWTPVWIIFLALTAREICLLVISFANEQPATFSTLSRRDDLKIDPPPSVILENHATEMIRKFEASENSTNLAATFEKLEKLLAGIQNVTFIADEDTLEAAFLLVLAKQQRQLVRTFSSKKDVNRVLGSAYAIKHEVDYVQLLKLVAVSYCLRSKISVHFYGQTGDWLVDVCAPEQLLYLNEDAISFKLSAPIHFKNAYDRLRISCQHLTLTEEKDNDITAVSVNFRGVSHIEEDVVKESSLSVKARQLVVSEISVFAVWKRLNRRTAPCSSDELYYNCKHRCNATAYFELCGYWPLAYVEYAPHNFSALSSDVTEPGQSCDSEMMTSSIDNCVQHCSPDCTMRSYMFVTSVAYMEANDSSRLVRSDISAKFNHFALFQELPSMSWEAFLSQVGGALGLYLGLSFAQLLHFLILLTGYLCKRKADLTQNSATDSMALEAAQEERIVQLVLERLRARKEGNGAWQEAPLA